MPEMKRQPPREPFDMTPLLEKYEGKWVALTGYTPDSEVICSGKDPKEVYKRATKMGHDAPLIFMVSHKLAHAMIM